MWQPTLTSARRRKQRIILGIAAGGGTVVVAIIIAIVAATRGPVGLPDSQPAAATQRQGSGSPVTVIPPPDAPAPPAADATPPVPPQPEEQPRPWRDAGHVPLFKQFTSPQPLAQAPLEPASADPPSSPPAEPIGSQAAANDPALREFESAKKWLAAAALRDNKVLMTNGARAMMLWHDFFEKSPHAFHKPAAEEAKALADEHVPGISQRPRITPPAGPPVPPQLQQPPQDRTEPPPADRPDSSQRPRPPLRGNRAPPPR